MKDRASDATLHLRKWTRIILTGIAGLIAFSPLVGCVSLGYVPVTTTPTLAPTAASTSIVTATTTATATPTPQQTPGPGWKLTWSDEFDGPAGAPPDPSKWSSKTGGEGWGNQQLDYDTNDQNAYQDGQGNLVLEARRSNPDGYECWYGYCQYTSAQITTAGHFSYTYGLLEARIKVPAGQGFWSAFWLLGNNYNTVGWPDCGEIDVMEILGSQPAMLNGTVHGPGYFTGAYALAHSTFADGFHVFALQWDPDHLYFYVDGNNYATLNRKTLQNQSEWVYNHPFSIILNLPIGGNWPGNPGSNTIFPEKMYISYIRLYQTTGSAST